MFATFCLQDVFDAGVFDPGVFEDWCYDDAALLKFTIDQSLNIFPTGDLPVQDVAPMVWTLDTTRIAPDKILEARYDEDIDGSVSWSMQLALGSDAPNEFGDPLGGPVSWLGPPGGKLAIRLDGLYFGSNGARKFPVMKDGLVHNSKGRYTRKRAKREISGTGAVGRYQRLKGELAWPPGHNHTREEAAHYLLLACNVPVAKLALIDSANPDRFLKSFELSNESGMDLARDILGGNLKTIVADSDGLMVVRQLAFDPDQRTEGTIKVQNVVDPPGIEDSPNIDGATRVTVLAETPQLTDGECQGISNALTTEVFKDYAPAVTKDFQRWVNPDCIVIATGSSPNSQFRLFQRSVVTTTTECGTTVAVRVDTYGWYNPQAPTKAIGGSPVDNEPCPRAYIEADGTGHLKGIEHWMLISTQLTTREFSTKLDTDSDPCYLTRETVEKYNFYSHEKAQWTKPADDPGPIWINWVSAN